MRPVRFNEANVDAGKEYPYGTPRFCVGGATMFCFQPDEVEAAAIAAGAAIWVVQEAGQLTAEHMIPLRTLLTTVSPFMPQEKRIT